MNTILVILDSLRKDHVGIYGNEWIQTPHLDAFGHSAAVFDRAYPESLPTLPVRRALHTGRRTFPFTGYRRRKGDRVAALGWAPIPEDQITLAEALARHAVNTAFITDTYHQFKPSMNFHRGFRQFSWIRGQEMDAYRTGGDVDARIDEHLFSKQAWMFSRVPLLEQYFKNTQARREERDYFAPRVFREAMAWLDENAHEGSFFLVVDSFDPHEPWDPPEKYRKLYPGAQDYAGNKIITSSYGDLDPYAPGELDYMRACYAGEVTLVDAWFGKFVAKVDELGLRDDTLIVVVSDHGHQLGEHGITGKVPWGLYPELVDLVLMVSKPGAPPRRVPEIVYNLDVVPAILAHHHLAPADLPGMDARDVTPLVTGTPDWPARPHVTVAFTTFVLAVTDRWAYITDSEHAREALYDLEVDPNMFEDIAGTHPAECEAMREYVVADAGGQAGLDQINAMVPTVGKQVAEWYEMDVTTAGGKPGEAGKDTQ